MTRAKVGTMNRTMRLARMTVAAGAVLAVVATAVPATSASSGPSRFPGTNGRIAYSGDDGTDNEIFTINPNGGGRQRVTDNTIDDFRPDWGVRGR